jgi:hypothetical protein
MKPLFFLLIAVKETFLNDDETAQYHSGKRVFIGDTVSIITGKYEVMHTYNNRVFGVFSKDKGSEETMCFASSMIQLVDD